MAAILGLTLRQPWAWAIAEQQKDVENRAWRTNYRGPVAIHAGAGIDHGAVMPTERAARALRALRARAKLANALPPEASHMRLSRIVAVAELAGIHSADECMLPAASVPGGTRAGCSPWAMHGQWHWELRDVRRLPEPIPCKGRLGLWKLPEDVERAVMEQLEASHA